MIFSKRSWNNYFSRVKNIVKKNEKRERVKTIWQYLFYKWFYLKGFCCIFFRKDNIPKQTFWTYWETNYSPVFFVFIMITCSPNKLIWENIIYWWKIFNRNRFWIAKMNYIIKNTFLFLFFIKNLIILVFSLRISYFKNGKYMKE